MTKDRSFKEGDLVFVREFPSGSTWLPDTLVRMRGPLSCEVKLEDGCIKCHHVDHLQQLCVSASGPHRGALDLDDIPAPEEAVPLVSDTVQVELSRELSSVENPAGPVLLF